MIVHGDRKFDDSVLKPYGFTRRICRSYYQNECEIFMVYGMPEGIGKSAYVHHTLADAYGFQAEKDHELLQLMWKKKPSVDVDVWESDWKRTKDFVLYLPEEVVKRCKNMLLRGERNIAFHWDDAGTWLNAMEWHDPFVIAFMEYLSLARSNWGAVILSTPVDDWVLKKLRTATGLLRIPIIKLKDNFTHPFRPREARCYKIVRYPGRVRPYWNTQFRDTFMAIMPDPFYEWYQPRRDKYTLLAALKMEKALKKRKARGWDISVDEETLEEIKKHIWRAGDEAEDFREVIAQKTQEER